MLVGLSLSLFDIEQRKANTASLTRPTQNIAWNISRNQFNFIVSLLERNLHVNNITESVASVILISGLMLYNENRST